MKEHFKKFIATDKDSPPKIKKKSEEIIIPKKSDQKTIISRAWQMTTLVGNGVIGMAEIATGNISTPSVAVDGFHNLGDTLAYGIQTENILDQNLSEEKRNKRRKVAHTIIFTSSVLLAAKAGSDLSIDNGSVENVGALYSAGASLGLNTLLGASLYRNLRRQKKEDRNTHTVKDLTKHLFVVDIPSAGLAVIGAAAQKYGVNGVEPAAAIVSGSIAAWVFRPTKRNLHAQENSL